MAPAAACAAHINNMPFTCKWQRKCALESDAAVANFRIYACIGNKIKNKPTTFQRNTLRNSRFASKGDEAREILANTLLNHVPVARYNFQAKVHNAAHCLQTVPVSSWEKLASLAPALFNFIW